jgi:hypothetical protein
LDGGPSNSLQCDSAGAVFSNNSDREAQGNKVRYSTVWIAAAWGTEGLSAERRMQFVARAATDCHVYGQVYEEAER